MIANPKRMYTKQGYLKLKDGSLFNKYQTKNPISKYLINSFQKHLLELVHVSQPQSVHEIGCGEGELSRLIALKTETKNILASDADKNCITHAKSFNYSDIQYKTLDIYDLDPKQDSAELIVCCEVLEHLPNPSLALTKILQLNSNFFIFSVPNEPLWRILNMLRGKYWTNFGNTPTHIQHWSTTQFTQLLSSYFEILDVRTPLPWSMILCKKHSSK